jgi:hypothetical protein
MITAKTRPLDTAGLRNTSCLGADTSKFSVSCLRLERPAAWLHDLDGGRL